MKILYICGTYAPGAFAGSELSAHQLFKQLNADPEIKILVATDQKYTDGKTIRSEYEGVKLQGIKHEQRQMQIHEVILSFRPDVIYTQLLWSDVAVELGEYHGVPTVLRIPSISDYQDILRPTALVGNSRFVCNWAENKSGRHCHYIFPTIDLDRVVASPSQRKPRFITMFNPIRDKGGHIFLEIAKSIPDKEFAVVPGWHSLRRPDGSWDKKIIENSIESQNCEPGSWFPEDIDFEKVENVQVLEAIEHVANIFAITRLLLIPSQYSEAMGRVSIEAFANGIPVIGSQVGGLQEQVGKSGYLIKDYSNPGAWVSAIQLMDDETIYSKYSEKAIEFIKNDFDNSRVYNEFKHLFSEVIKAHNRKEKL